MAKFGDRVKETTDTTGTGTLQLDGAPTGFFKFADEFTSGNEVYYLIVDDPSSPTEFEFGIGTFTAGTPDTLSRDTVEGSTNSGNKVSFSAGTKTVISTPTAASLNGGNAIPTLGTAATKNTGTGIGNVVELESDGASPEGARLPAVDGSQLTNLPDTGLSAASQAEMEAATATDKAVTPGRQHFHPGNPKAWAAFNGATGSIAASYGVSSVTDNATGVQTVNFSVAMSSTSYAVAVTCGRTDSNNNSADNIGSYKTPATGSVTSTSLDRSGSFEDSERMSVIVLGDQ